MTSGSGSDGPQSPTPPPPTTPPDGTSEASSGKQSDPSHRSALHTAWIGLAGVLGAAVIAGVFSLLTSDGGHDDPVGPPGPAPTTTAAPTTPAPTPTTADPTTSTGGTATAQADDKLSPTRLLRLSQGDCDPMTYIDFDVERLTLPIDEDEMTNEQHDGYDLTWENCYRNLKAQPGRSVGVLPAGTQPTEEACREAANGGGAEDISFSISQASLRETGLEKGASLCILTDRDRLVRAEVTKADTRSHGSLLEFTVTQWK